MTKKRDNDPGRPAPRRAAAHPTKAFFVRMLTRDISLEDCILDLVDNSIDAAWKGSGHDPTELKETNALSKFSIAIDVDRDSFVIVDNCRGITLDDAAQYAFTFGREELGGEATDYSVGVYGIGMKRAVFKIGNNVQIFSTPEEGDPFVVPINVGRWLATSSQDWDFDIDSAEALEEPGVKVDVTDLNSDAIDLFDDPAFAGRLRETLARDYMLPLMHGLSITVNDESVPWWPATFKQSTDFAPMRFRYKDDSVNVEIIAGMAASPPDGDDPGSVLDGNESGWYIICNGRVVLAADRTDLTVWGRNRFPAWHPQYEGFLGVAIFSSHDPSLLPMTTTKRSVDEASGLYRRATAEMQKPTRSWIDYTNARKSKREVAREKESAAKSTPIGSVRERKTVKLPKTEATKTTEANVLFTRPVQRVRKLGKAFGKSTMPYKEVGERSFDYAYERLVEEG